MLNAVSMKIKTPVRPTPALQGKKERKKREKNQTFKIAPQFFTRQEIYSDLLNVAAGHKRVFFWKELRDKNLFNQISRIGPILSRFFIPISPSDNSSQILKSTNDVQ